MRSAPLRSRRFLAAAIVLIGTLASPAQALYELPEGFASGIYGRVEVGQELPGSPMQTVEDERLDPSPVTDGAYVLTVANQAGFNSAATVVGQVGRGFARLDAIAIARQEGEGTSGADVVAGVAFSDVITLSSPGRNGTPGSALLGVFVDGALSTANGGNDSEVSSSAFGWSTVYGSDREILVASPDPFLNPAEILEEEFLGRVVEFVYGQPFAFSFVLEVSGDATASVSEPGRSVVASFVGDFGQTMTWAGIQELRDANGDPVLDFEVTSASGTDYRDRIVPVPEPDTALSMLTVLILLAWHRR